MRFIAALLVAVVVAAVSPDASAQGERPKTGGTLVVGRPTDAISLDPHKATTAPEVWVYGIKTRDLLLVQGCVLVLAAGFVLVNLLTDLSYTLLDPPIRFEHRA